MKQAGQSHESCQLIMNVQWNCTKRIVPLKCNAASVKQ